MPSVPTSTTIRRLRELAGLSIDELAARAGLPVSAVQRAEKGGGPITAFTPIAVALGVDPKPLLAGAIKPASSVSGSVFLFNGDISSLTAADVPALCAALDHGRQWVASDVGRLGMSTRLSVRPRIAAGPTHTDAARQGYALATELRGLLGVGVAPLDDLRRLAEERLGVVVTVSGLSSTSLRAASILDLGRGCAAVVLHASLRDGALQRVAIAHELCHLVYDPEARDAVRLTLDRIVDASGHDLTEARARGFAAEFLMPARGLAQLLGPPRAEPDEAAARRLVSESLRHFHTSWELTTHHLHNRGFIGHLTWQALLENRGRRVSPSMPLPAIDAPPLCLDGVQNVVRGLEASREARRTVEACRVEVDADLDNRAAALADSVTEQSQTHPMRAGVDLATALDTALDAGQTSFALRVLERLDPARVQGDAMVLALATLRSACEVVGSPLLSAHRTLAARTLDALTLKWGWSAEDVLDARTTLT